MLPLVKKTSVFEQIENVELCELFAVLNFNLLHCAYKNSGWYCTRWHSGFYKYFFKNYIVCLIRAKNGTFLRIYYYYYY